MYTVTANGYNPMGCESFVFVTAVQAMRDYMWLRKSGYSATLAFD